MKLCEIRKDYERYSTNVSQINRKLIFVGIAVIWLFRISGNNQTEIPSDLHRPLFFLCLSCFFDILQYVSQSIMWASYYCYQKRKRNSSSNVEEEIVKEPEWPNIFNWILWGIKVISTIIAYIYLGSFLRVL